MIDPITAFTAATTAFNTIKKLVAAGREVQDVTTQLGKWFGAAADFNLAAVKAESKKQSIFRSLIHAGSVEEEALNTVVHRQKLMEMEKELRELITYAYGADVYAEMLAIRRQIREDREKKEREHRARQKAAAEATFWWSIAAVLASLLIYIGYVLVDMAKARSA